MLFLIRNIMYRYLPSLFCCLQVTIVHYSKIATSLLRIHHFVLYLHYNSGNMTVVISLCFKNIFALVFYMLLLSLHNLAYCCKANFIKYLLFFYVAENLETEKGKMVNIFTWHTLYVVFRNTLFLNF